ncbi:hypothetical protein HDU93_000521, partial [Gonapodya sp. JEL0774]
LSVIWRLIRADGTHLWLESIGHKYELDNRKRTKCFVLTCRPRSVETVIAPEIASSESSLYARMVAAPAGNVQSGWMRVSREGFVLYANPSAADIVCGVEMADSATLYGKRLVDLVDGEFAKSVGEAVAAAASSPALSSPIRREVRLSVNGVSWVRLEMHAVGDAGSSWHLFVVVERVDTAKPYLEDLDVDLTGAGADLWSLLQVADQSSLNHKANWLKSHNKKLEEELAALMGAAA